MEQYIIIISTIDSLCQDRELTLMDVSLNQITHRILETKLGNNHLNLNQMVANFSLFFDISI